MSQREIAADNIELTRRVEELEEVLATQNNLILALHRSLRELELDIRDVAKSSLLTQEGPHVQLTSKPMSVVGEEAAASTA